MICYNCHKNVTDGKKFCAYCGAPLGSYAEFTRQQAMPPVKKKHKGLKIAAVLCAIVVGGTALGTAAYMLFDRTKKDKSGSPEYSEDNIGELYFEKTEAEHIVQLKDCENIWYADNEVLLAAKDGTDFSYIEDIAEDYGAEIVGYIEQTGDYQLKFDKSLSQKKIEKIADELTDDENIESACLDYVMNVSPEKKSTPLDMKYGSEWDDLSFNGVTQLDSKGNKTKNWHINACHVPDAWWCLDTYSSDMRPVKVGLIDFGFAEHEDVEFADTFYDNVGDDHGIHVAGIMAALNDNDKGICGVYPYGKGNLYGVSYPGVVNYEENTGGMSLIAYKCAFAELILRNVRVINVSLGCGDFILYFDKSSYISNFRDMSLLMGDFFLKLLDKGYDFVIVNSAGNDSNDYRTTLRTDSSGNVYTEVNNKGQRRVYYDSNGKEAVIKKYTNSDSYYYSYNNEAYTLDDASHLFSAKDSYGCLDAALNTVLSGIPHNDGYEKVYDRIIVVGAFDIKGGQYVIANFSNGGKRTDVYAPGVDIYSSIPKNNKGEKYDYMNGTSMASPYVAGIAAMVWTVDNNFTGSEVKKLVCSKENTTLLQSNVKCGDERFEARKVDALYAVAKALNSTGSSVETDPANAAILSFIVDKKTDKPIPDAEIVAEDTDTGEKFTAITDDFGHFELILPEGEYYLSVDHDGYEHYDWPDSDDDPHTIKVSNGNVNYLADGQGLSDDEVGWIKLVPETVSITDFAQMSSDEIVALMGGTYTVSTPAYEQLKYFGFSNYKVFPNLIFICDVEDYNFTYGYGNSSDSPKWDESFVRGLIESGSIKIAGVKVCSGSDEFKITNGIKSTYKYNDIAKVIGEFSCNSEIEPFIVHGAAGIWTKVIDDDNCEITLQFGESDAMMTGKSTISAQEMKKLNRSLSCVTVKPYHPNTKTANIVSVSEDFSEKAGLIRNTDLFAGPSGQKWIKLENLSNNQEINVLHNVVKYSGEYWYYVLAESGKKGWIKSEDIAWYGGKEKPVIYLYPEKETEVNVKLTLTDGKFTCTYPDYRNGWSVTAEPDGTLYDNYDGKEYSYLYWEGLGDTQWDFSEGFVVRREDTAEFLREKLTLLGLTPREYNEFIVYWLPKMQENEYNLISFQTDRYTDSAKLDITPKPDSVQRVFMAYKACDGDTEVPEQELEPFVREGFTVIEWGGTEVRDR